MDLCFGKRFPLLIKTFIIAASLTLGIPKAYALVPLESLLLGDFSDQYQNEISDPLYYIFRDFTRDQNSTDSENYAIKELKLNLYKGAIEEGLNLRNSCKKSERVLYPTQNEYENARRVYLATLQFMVLDITTNYLPLYAKYFDFSKEDYTNLTDNLIGNFCSQNITTISLKQLRTNMLVRYENTSNHVLPNIDKDPFFPSRLKKVNGERSSREQEFSWTLDLFKSACSWSNDVTNLRLLVPLARHPIIAAAVIREIAGQGMSWDKKKERIVKITEDQALRISCRNMICRKTEKETFLQQIPRSIGSSSLSNDFERLYCSDFRNSDFTLKNQEPKITEIIKQLTFDDQFLLSGQMVSLMTGYPDYMVRADEFSDLMEHMRASMDQSWDNWAKRQNKNYQTTMTYEESLTVEAVPSELYFRKLLPNFSIELDINQGEFDEAVNMVGKIRVRMDLDFSHQFLSWARREWKTIDEKEEPQRAERLRIPFRKRIEDQLTDLKAKFPTVPWGDQFGKLIIDEILYEISSYEGTFFSDTSKKKDTIAIPVYLNFSPFALRHMRYRYLIEKNQNPEDSELTRLRNLKLY